MRVLVAGGKGFIGRYVVQLAQKRGHDVVVSGRGDTDVLARDGFDAVIWSAGGRVPDVEQGLEVHARAPARILQASGATRFIYLGSGECYGLQDVPFREDMTLKGTSPYARAKIAGEEAVAEAALNFGAAVFLLRPAVVFGAGQKGQMLVPALLNALRQRRHFPMTAGEQTRDARKIVESPHFFAAAAELAAVRGNPQGASARIQQALGQAPELARYLVPGLVEAERQLAESEQPRAAPRDAGLDAELEGETLDSIKALPAPEPPVGETALVKSGAGTGEPGKIADLDRAAAERAAAALREVLVDAGDAPGAPHVQLALAELEAVYDPGKALADYRAIATRFPDLLPARVAAARLALADGDTGAITQELKALAGPGGTLGWAFDGSWRCGQCGRRGLSFFWRCAQCRRWGTARLDIGRDAQLPPRPQRERREVPRVSISTLLGTDVTEALPEPTLEHGLTESELSQVGARPSVIGRFGNWISGTWSGRKGKAR